jgi:hypothetical protein
MSFESYAQRLLNPFRGSVHTLRHHSAEAITTDGVHWDIYVANTILLPEQDGVHEVQVGDMRYGSWSAAQGLRRGRLSPSEDFRRMEAMGADLYEHLIQTHQRVPFAFTDHIELWLLDADTRPLALLHSVSSETDIELAMPITWRAGMAAREQFNSGAMEALRAQGSPDIAAADYVAHYVNRCAGKKPAAQWFRREPDGSGRGLRGISLPAGLEGRVLDETLFPPLFLADTGHDAGHQRLIEDFLAWQAPWLLLLPHLDSATRRSLERRARLQVFTLEKQFRLYPAIVDAGAIQAARVEAVMRRSQLPPQRQEDIQATFYIELSPSGDE